jgi:hypothetical protein
MSVMSKEIEATVHQSLMGMRIAAVSVMSVEMKATVNKS